VINLNVRGVLFNGIAFDLYPVQSITPKSFVALAMVMVVIAIMAVTIFVVVAVAWSWPWSWSSCHGYGDHLTLRPFWL
jgi:hypothetical protein